MRHISVIGGGPAGLAVGYYAAKADMQFTIYEAQNRIGGNCSTLQQGEFRFDSGAHRLHDRDPEITAEVQSLLGSELKRISLPSRIYNRGQFLVFPLTPLGLLRGLGAATFTHAAFEVVKARIHGNRAGTDSFERFARHMYGNIIAERFLLNYSEKLWGASCADLSMKVAGKRLKGLDLRSFISEALLGRITQSRHMEGNFYYPDGGIGRIIQRIGETCGTENIRLGARVTRVIHDTDRVKAIEVNGSAQEQVDGVVSSMPLSHLIEMLDPQPPRELVDIARSLRYRHIILVAHFLDTERITDSATVYFPEKAVPFTRVYEPKNRSIAMSPPGKTSLVAELPCQEDDEVWGMPDTALVGVVRSQLERLGWLDGITITGAAVERMPYAYPILEIGFDERVNLIKNYLSNFGNLKLSGRNGTFTYSWLHDMMRFGMQIVDDYTTGLSA